MRQDPVEPPTNEVIASILDAVRASGLSLRELAELSGVPHSTIANFLRGRVPKGAESLLALAKAVGVTVVVRRRRQRRP